MIKTIWKHMLIVLWAVTLALLTVSALGATHIFSRLFGEAHVALAADIALPFLSIVYAVFLFCFAPRPRSCLFTITGFVLPCLLLWVFFF